MQKVQRVVKIDMQWWLWSANLLLVRVAFTTETAPCFI